jgi:hypothetical protein
MALTDHYVKFWGIDAGSYNGMCTGCGELQWRGLIPPKDLRKPGWEDTQRAFGYLPGPRLDFPGIVKQ